MRVFSLKVLGIDPGVASTGWGVVETDSSSMNGIKAIAWGVIKTQKGVEPAKRLAEIYTQLGILFKKYKPDFAALEKLFFCKNSKTVMAVGEARGVAILAIEIAGLKYKEFTPLQVKDGICGYGRAEKKQVQLMVKALLNMDELPRPDDAADGLAVAVCCANSVKFEDKIKKAKAK